MRDRVLRLCLHAYPEPARDRDGRAIIDLAREACCRSRLGFLREAAGMLVGGAKARCALVRHDITAAPWGAALEHSALPLAVALFCLFVGYASAVRPPISHVTEVVTVVGGVADVQTGSFIRVDWWGILGLIGGVGAAFGAASSRRFVTVVGTLLLLGLLVFDAFDQLSGQSARWWGDVYIGELNVLAMWLPVPLLLLVSAGAVGRTALRRGRTTLVWMLGVPVAVTIVVSNVVKHAVLESGLGASPLGGVFIWTPVLLVVALIARGVIQKDAVAKTAGGLLVVAGSVPFMWLLAFLVREPPVPGQYLPFVYYLPGLIVACLIMLLLLRSRSHTPVPPGPADCRE